MTEAEWLTSADPAAMLHALAAQSVPGHVDGLVQKLGDRKLRLFACACCWLTELEDRDRRVIDVAEAYADERARFSDLEKVTWMAPDSLHLRTWVYVLHFMGGLDCAATVLHNQRVAGVGNQHRQSDLLREIAGNPFQRVSICPQHYRSTVGGDLVHVFDCPDPEEGYHAPNCPLAWRDGTVARMAANIYEGRDWGAMPVLADALEDAGCAEAAILSHLRQERQHALGCWVIDLLTSRK